jgi:GTP cyclohydrolase I
MAAVRTLLAWAGDDPRREGLIDTPSRVVGAFSEWFAGYQADPAKELSRTFEDVQGYDDIVMLRDIDVESHCEHHMAPFLGKAWVAYMPTNAVVGISKIAKVVEIFSKRLQTQETMTQQIIGAINDTLKPAGAGGHDRRPAPVHDHPGRPPQERVDHHHPVHGRLQDRHGAAGPLPALHRAVLAPGLTRRTGSRGQAGHVSRGRGGCTIATSA